MKKYPQIIFALYLTLMCGCSVINARPANNQDDWFSKDKLAHFAISTAMSAGIAKTARDNGEDKCDAALIGFSISLTIGASKEIFDKRKKKTLYSYKDMTWNLAGSAFGSLAASSCR